MKTKKNLMTCLKEKSSSSSVEEIKPKLLKEIRHEITVFKYSLRPHVSVGKFLHLGDPLAHP